MKRTTLESVMKRAFLNGAKVALCGLAAVFSTMALVALGLGFLSVLTSCGLSYGLCCWLDRSGMETETA